MCKPWKIGLFLADFSVLSRSKTAFIKPIHEDWTCVMILLYIEGKELNSVTSWPSFWYLVRLNVYDGCRYTDFGVSMF